MDVCRQTYTDHKCWQDIQQTTNYKGDNQKNTEPTVIQKLIIAHGFRTCEENKNIYTRGLGPENPNIVGISKKKSATVINYHIPEWNFKASFDIDEKVYENIIMEDFDEQLRKQDCLGTISVSISSVQKDKKILKQ